MNSAVRQSVGAQAEAKVSGMGDVRVLNAAERQLRDGGIGVDVDVVGISKMRTTVDWYLDLGVLSSDKRRGRLRPGSKSLLPDGKLISLQTQVRTNLYSHSFVVGLLGSYRYIPDDAFLDWKERHDEIVSKIEAEKANLVDNYDNVRMDTADDFREMASETWEALLARGDEDEQAFTRRYTRAEFQEAVVAKALNKMPSAEEIEEEIRVEVKVATWLLPNEAAQEALETERIRAQAQKEREDRDSFLKVMRAHDEEIEARAKAKTAEHEAAEIQAKEEARLTIVEAQAKEEAIKAAQLELAREAVSNMANPMLEMLNDLRGQMLDITRKALTNITKHGRVMGKQVQAMENMVSAFQMLNAAGDSELESKITALSEALEIRGVTHKRDTGAITVALREIASVAMEQAEVAIDLAEHDEWDALGI